MITLETFAERYPHLELLTRHHTGKLPQKILSPKKADLIYAIGAHRLTSCCDFLENGGKIVIIEKTLSGIAALRDEEPLISHPNVDLFYFSGDVEASAKRLATAYPLRHIAIAGRARALREALLRHTAIAHTFLCEDLYRHELLKNLVANYRRIPGSFDVGALTMKGVPAIICGAGPSLIPQELDRFATKALIIGGGSAIPVVGNKLHLAVAFDPNEEEYYRLKSAEIGDVPLIYGARVYPRIFTIPHGPRGYMRTGTGGEIDFWIENHFKLAPMMSKLDFGEEALSVTTMCIALAASMGCSPIILVGCDLARTGGKEYAADVSVRALHTGVAETAVGQTRVKWILEAQAISAYAKRHKEIEWINATPSGLSIPGIAHRPLETLELPDQGDIRERLRAQYQWIAGDVTQPLEELKESLLRCKTYLARISYTQGKDHPHPSDHLSDIAHHQYLADIGSSRHQKSDQTGCGHLSRECEKYGLEKGVTLGTLVLLEDEIAYRLLIEPIRSANRRLGNEEWGYIKDPLEKMLHLID